MKREHDDDCACRRGFECDCGCDETETMFVTATPAIQENIGRKVISRHYYGYRKGEIAEIVGWGYMKENLCYTIRFNDMHTEMIIADEQLMEAFGYEFVAK